MKREILFRGKRIDNGEWVYGSYQPFIGETELKIFFDMSDKRNHEYKKLQINKHLIAETKMPDYQGWDYSSQIRYTEVKPKTIGQFTGLTDKNGKKVFTDDVYKDDEGDLFKVVQMDCGRYALELIEDGYVDEFIDWSYVEIIGNIHDNEKLKQ